MVNIYQKMTSCWAANHSYKHRVANKSEKKTKNLSDCSPLFSGPQRFNFEHLTNYLAARENTQLLKPQGGIMHAALRLCLSRHSVLGISLQHKMCVIIFRK